MSTELIVDPHPLLLAGCLWATYPAPLGTLSLPAALAPLRAQGAGPMATDDRIKKAVRDLLRHGGFKPAGRSRPASEYLVRATADAPLVAINLAVDLCNIVSLHSGLPISVVDTDLTAPPLALRLCEPGATYVFNASGQEIALGGLIEIHDAAGPCAGPVKDSHRTKTHEGTTRTLSVIWGSRALAERTRAALDWYAALHAEAGVEVVAELREPAAD